jgi:hypothetical protein
MLALSYVKIGLGLQKVPGFESRQGELISDLVFRQLSCFTFENFCLFYIIRPNVWTLFSKNGIHLAKYGFGYTLGDFFTKASGRPALMRP